MDKELQIQNSKLFLLSPSAGLNCTPSWVLGSVGLESLRSGPHLRVGPRESRRKRTPPRRRLLRSGGLSSLPDLAFFDPAGPQTLRTSTLFGPAGPAALRTSTAEAKRKGTTTTDRSGELGKGHRTSPPIDNARGGEAVIRLLSASTHEEPGPEDMYVLRTTPSGRTEPTRTRLVRLGRRPGFIKSGGVLWRLGSVKRHGRSSHLRPGQL